MLCLVTNIAPIHQSFATSFIPPKAMEQTTSSLGNLSASALVLSPFCGHSLRRKKGFRRATKAVNIKTLASKRDAYSHNFDGKIVDESMVVLRRRIHEMAMSEKSYEPPEHWMEWEKEYVKSSYDTDVCEAVGYLQYKLMETRPGVALGMVALLLFSVTTSMAVVLFHIMAMLKGLYEFTLPYFF